MTKSKQVLSTLLIAAALITTAAHAYDGEKYAKDAKISIKDARAIALKAYTGKIVQEELEKEKGGSGLRFSFDIKKDKNAPVQEVGIDAKTGAVLENDPESKNPD